MYISNNIKNILRFALEEDLGPSDVTTNLLVPEGQEAKALIVAKENFTVAGMPFFIEVFKTLDPDIKYLVNFPDGAKVNRGETLAKLTGNTHSLLAAERVALNILQRLSGIATLTTQFVDRIKGTNAKIIDTRKTTPGLRFMEKYAVRAGGGLNHRSGLYDGILIKDNHIAAVGSITKAILAARKAHHLLKVEIEVETLPSLREALKAGADAVMLDNMPLEDMKEAVSIAKGNTILEASGNIHLHNVRAIAETGVDLISIGSLTHSAPASDISMKIIRNKKKEGR